MTTGRNCTECTLDMAYCECHVTPAVTDNDKAAASEVSSSDRARDITALLREQARYLAALDINGWWNIMISAADFIESQRLALEEKDKQIASRDGLIKNLSAEIAEMVPKNEKLQAKVIEMETAINNYGRHLAYCGVHKHIVPEAKYCNCGLTDYLIARS